jgi:hypothetical protein
MTRHRTLLALASIALSTGVLGACSRSASSPTEPSLAAFEDSSKSLSSVSDDSRGRGGSGNDDGNAGNHRGRGRGADDGTADQGHRGRGRGNRPEEPRQPRAGQEFQGTVASVSGQTLTLAGGLRVTVGPQTQISRRGDLLSLGAIAASVAANERPRVEGRGERQADGSILATTLEAEVDD